MKNELNQILERAAKTSQEVKTPNQVLLLKLQLQEALALIEKTEYEMSKVKVVS